MKNKRVKGYVKFLLKRAKINIFLKKKRHTPSAHACKIFYCASFDYASNTARVNSLIFPFLSSVNTMLTAGSLEKPAM